MKSNLKYPIRNTRIFHISILTVIFILVACSSQGLFSQAYYQNVENLRIPKSMAAPKLRELLQTQAFFIQLYEQEDPGFGSIVKFQQYHNGYPVFGGQLSAQIKDDYVKAYHGAFIQIEPKVTSYVEISEEEALSIALEMDHASRYLWEDSRLDPPSGELIYAPSVDNNSFRLSGRFDLYSTDREGIFLCGHRKRKG